MKRKKLKIITLGCSKNSVDTEHLLAQIESEEGFYIVGEDDNYTEVLDYLLINTCGFIADAKEESIATILEAAQLKNEAKIKNLCVFGCLSQRYAKELREEIKEVDAWLGARDLNQVLQYLGLKSRFDFSARYFPRSSSYAYLKISEGCDRRCSYCAIPFIRGQHRSVPIETLVSEAKQLASKGVKELILIAQDTTFYGLDIYGRRALATLLEELSKIEEIQWLRIHYSYPASFPEDVIEQMAINPKVCRYLDIPLQHISDNVLSDMHRGVDGKWTRELIASLRSRVPGVVLRTTMIVGFPTEGEKEFSELLEFIQEAKFERLGTFAYSEEEGTWGAEHLSDRLDQESKEKRLQILMNAQRDISLRYNQSRVGTELRVIVDEIMNDGSLICRSEFESPEVDGEIIVQNLKNIDNIQIGSFINVKIVQAQDYDLIAEIL